MKQQLVKSTEKFVLYEMLRKPKPAISVTLGHSVTAPMATSWSTRVSDYPGRQFAE